MDIIFSLVLIIFNIYCFFLVGVESPAPTLTELGAAFWPRIIIVLMLILLVANIMNQLKLKKEKKVHEKIDVIGFLKSKLFLGMILIIIMAVSTSYVGFITSCFVFLVTYAILLGEKNIIKALLNSLIITFILYIIFQGLLDIRLERGIGIFRNLALFLEGILLNIKRGV
ncbi:tripartite tricarboxylate transporter TctB family protein [Cetobacterium sp.]|uniref:tripartite tricarboxylate transporter TctB family protein n=1 Tax=Cetobacterium sp. TaxID=2071632 RepID=UPI002FCB8941